MHHTHHMQIIVRTPLGKLQIITPLLGKHNVYNILAAVATGICLKVIMLAQALMHCTLRPTP